MSDAEKQTVVIADPDSDFLSWAAKHLGAKSIEILTTTRADEALKLFTDKRADLLIAELHLKPFDGVDLLKRARQNFPNAMVLLNGAISSTNTLIEAMRLGAFDVLRKESLSFELRPTVEKALQAAEQTRIATEAAAEKNPREASTDLIIGRSPAMQDVFKLIGRVARADAPVLITGESGVGKEVVANAVHKFSRRSNAEYVAINCAAIPGNLLESELFGHEKGAFTGATSQRIGRFEQCDGGTLFLDEIGDMPLEIQSKLLRVLQSGEFSRVGGNKTLTSNVRILAATNKHLETEVEAGRFREDLFYRLNVVRIHIPPLRQRREDIRLLAEYFLNRQGEGGGFGRRMQFSPESIDQLENHDWPGNVRELENTIQRACVLATGNVLLPRDLPVGRVPRIGGRDESSESAKAGQAPTANGSNGSLSLEAAAKFFLEASEAEGSLGPALIAEREIIRAVLADSGDDETAAAKRLGMTKSMLKKRREQYEL